MKPIILVLAALLYALSPSLFAEPLDINTATEEQLDEVMVGVGKTKAKAIIADREKNGKFSSVDELERVKGIGPATIAKNRSKITVGNGDAAPAAAKAAAPVASDPPPSPRKSGAPLSASPPVTAPAVPAKMP